MAWNHSRISSACLGASVSNVCAVIVVSTLSSRSIARFGSGCSVRAVIGLGSSPSAAGREHVLSLSVASSVGCEETFSR